MSQRRAEECQRDRRTARPACGEGVAPPARTATGRTRPGPAARQMRGRIRQAVLTHLRDADSDQDAERWSRHLRGLETAPISTIHAFCGTLLRQFAVETGLDPTFDVLEDVLSVNLEAEALTTSLQKLLTAQGTAGEDLRQLVLL